MPRPPFDAISTDEEVKPAAPISWIDRTAFAAINSRQASINNLPVNGSPTWTVGRFDSVSSENSAEAIVAPWIPSRPVLAPT